MASSSSSHQQNQEFNAFSGIEPAGKRREVCESSKLCDVFINHRGPDVKGTLATDLYKSLQQFGIEAFLDSEEKELGISFPSLIETAIRSAKVHIAIFSKRYAESPWCLAELALMLRSTAKIIPIFYQVKPSDLRYIETGVYAEAFIKYEEKGRYLEKLEQWREALRSLSFTAGEEFNSFGDWDCQKIVAAVQKEVQRKICLQVADYPVGLNNLVQDFEKRCLDELVQDFESQCGQEEGQHKAQIVGIFGMGGVGKTTLAKELFNRKSLNYTKASFLFDVREKSDISQLPSLQGKLFKDLFGKEMSFTSTEEGAAYLKDRLQRSPFLSFLIVVDDINHVEQLNALGVMDILKNSCNSLVIVTTRDAGVLITAGITVGYNLKGMDRNYARELFCCHAFRQDHPRSGYEVLVEDFLDVCGGLPLSLQVLGRHVHGRPRNYWSLELIKVRMTLPGDVKKRLLISFEALDGEEKQVFMDTACFFVGKPKNIAERVWEGSGWNAQHALETLKDRCLVEEIENRNFYIQGETVLTMHDHLRDLGREMAVELSPPHRLWRPQDLKSLKLLGFKTILTKTNIRCFSSIFDESMGSEITFFLGQSDSCLETSASLLWLQLEGNNGEQPSIPSWIPLQNLRCLKIRSGQFKTLWENRIQAPSQLRELKITETSFKKLPDFVGISDNLENVFLDARGLPIQGLSLLESLNMKLSSLCLLFSTLSGEQASTTRGERTPRESLVILNFKFNGELHWTSGKVPLRGLEKIEISREEFVSKILISGVHYPSLESIKLHQMENLREVDLTGVNTLNFLHIRNCSKLKRLAATSDLLELRELTISGCPVLEELPFLYRVNDMEKIKISPCEKIQNIRLPSTLVSLCIEDFRDLQTVAGNGDILELRELTISRCPVLEELPCLYRVNDMERIKISQCEKIKNIRLPSTLVSLCIEYCTDLQTVAGNGDILELRELTISGCPVLEELPFLYRVNNMEKIKISECKKIQNIRLPSTLVSLCIEYCRDLQTVAGNGDILELRELTISRCPVLEELPCLYRVNDMEKIEISGCVKIQNIRLPATLVSLCIKDCRDLQTVAGNGDILELRELTISRCPVLEELPCLYRVNDMEKIEISQCEKIQNIRLPSTLVSLFIEDCTDLQTVAGNGDILELRELTIRRCPVLEELPCLYRVNDMKKIKISGCVKIQNIRLPSTLVSLCIKDCRDLQTVAGNGDILELRELTISRCPVLDELPCLYRVNDMEKIEISQCEKIQNIRLPSTLVSLFIEDCTDLQTVAGNGDILELRELTISGCPVLEELPCLYRVNDMKKIKISGCVKIQNIRLPSTLVSLCIKDCTDLQTVAGNGDILELRELTISLCPVLEELPCLYRVNDMEKIEIFGCEKIQNIRLPSTLVSLCIEYCTDLQTVAGNGDILELRELTISGCPVLEELPFLYRVNDMKKIKISGCVKIQNIRLPSTLVSLCIKDCTDLQTVAGNGDILELRELTISRCPVLEELPCLYRVNDMEKIEISGCVKIQNIRLPATLVSLCIKDCRDLQTVAGNGDILELRELTISRCPVLEELPCLYRVNDMEKIEIFQCEKIQNIRLPSTLVSLFIEDCRDLQRVAGTGDLLELRKLTIKECPRLEELPSLCRFSFTEKIVIDSCDKLQNIAGIEELNAPKYMRFSYCSNALIQNSIHKLKSGPSKAMVMVGRAVDGAESCLNENLFGDANIGVHRVIEIDVNENLFQAVRRECFLLCLLVAVDSNTSAGDASLPYITLFCGDSPLKVREGEWVITAAGRDCEDDSFWLLTHLRRRGILKKGIWDLGDVEY